MLTLVHITHDIADLLIRELLCIWVDVEHLEIVFDLLANNVPDMVMDCLAQGLVFLLPATGTSLATSCRILCTLHYIQILAIQNI